MQILLELYINSSFKIQYKYFSSHILTRPSRSNANTVFHIDSILSLKIPCIITSTQKCFLCTLVSRWVRPSFFWVVGMISNYCHLFYSAPSLASMKDAITLGIIIDST